MWTLVAHRLTAFGSAHRRGALLDYLRERLLRLYPMACRTAPWTALQSSDADIDLGIGLKPCPAFRAAAATLIFSPRGCHVRCSGWRCTGSPFQNRLHGQ